MVNRRKRHINTWAIFTLLFWSPIFAAAGGYDDFGGSSSASGGGSSGGSSASGSSAGGVDINDYASNNGQIPNHLVSEPTVSFKNIFIIFKLRQKITLFHAILGVVCRRISFIGSTNYSAFWRKDVSFCILQSILNTCF